jgi:hypothetical protein
MKAVSETFAERKGLDIRACHCNQHRNVSPQISKSIGARLCAGMRKSMDFLVRL